MLKYVFSRKVKMKLDCVLTGCDLTPLYLDFVPFFVRMWNKLYPSVDVRIVLIADAVPEGFKAYAGNIILFPPLPGISTAFISQYVRLLYPSLLKYENGVMITDMDDVPLNTRFFTRNIAHFPNDRWINMRDWEHSDRTGKQIAMCWQVATPETWKEVFGIAAIEEVAPRLREVYERAAGPGLPRGYEWGMDQMELYRYVMEWNRRTNRYVRLADARTGYHRLCRATINRQWNRNIISQLRAGYFSDYHALRPFSDHVRINMTVYHAVACGRPVQEHTAS